MKMRKARHLDISNRLEATRQLGLVEDFSIEWRQAFCPPQVIVRGRAGCPEQVTKNYISALLAKLVPSRSIVVTSNI